MVTAASGGDRGWTIVGGGRVGEALAAMGDQHDVRKQEQRSDCKAEGCARHCERLYRHAGARAQRRAHP